MSAFMQKLVPIFTFLFFCSNTGDTIAMMNRGDGHSPADISQEENGAAPAPVNQRVSAPSASHDPSSASNIPLHGAQPSTERTAPPAPALNIEANLPLPVRTPQRSLLISAHLGSDEGSGNQSGASGSAIAPSAEEVTITMGEGLAGTGTTTLLHPLAVDRHKWDQREYNCNRCLSCFDNACTKITKRGLHFLGVGSGAATMALAGMTKGASGELLSLLTTLVLVMTAVHTFCTLVLAPSSRESSSSHSPAPPAPPTGN